jgi:hypothetical protein
MHDLYARYVTRAAGWRRLGTAAAHYCRGADAAAFASAVAEAAAAGAGVGAGADEEALFPARAALQTVACARGAGRADRAAHAAAFLQAYPAARRKAAAAAAAAAPPSLPDAPVCRFAEMFVELLANHPPSDQQQQQIQQPPAAARQVSQLLRQRYAPCLASPDASLAACAMRAERVWFPQPGAGGGGLGGGLLGGLLQGLLGDDGDDDDE